jgi:transcriptional regulator with XRE-family HTH domain
MKEENLFKLYRKRAGYSQKEVAQILHVTASAVSSWESGRYIPDPQNLKALADLYCVSTDALLGRQGIEPHPIQEQPEIEFEEEIFLPIVASLRCGYGQAGEPYICIGKHGVPRSWAKRYGKDIVLNYALGDSMIPTILPGELMVCYPGDWWDDGTVAVITVNDTETVKRIYHAKDGGIDLIPENPKYKIMHYTPQEIEEYHIHVLGHVVTTIPQEIAPIPRREE